MSSFLKAHQRLVRNADVEIRLGTRATDPDTGNVYETVEFSPQGVILRDTKTGDHVVAQELEMRRDMDLEAAPAQGPVPTQEDNPVQSIVKAAGEDKETVWSNDSFEVQLVNTKGQDNPTTGSKAPVVVVYSRQDKTYLPDYVALPDSVQAPAPAEEQPKTQVSGQAQQPAGQPQAAPMYKDCPVCNGKGTLNNGTVPCTNCSGLGKLPQTGAQKLANGGTCSACGGKGTGCKVCKGTGKTVAKPASSSAQTTLD